MLLFEASKHTKISQTAQNYLARYQKLFSRKSIPEEITKKLHEKFPVKINPSGPENYIEEFKMILSSLLFKETADRILEFISALRERDTQLSLLGEDSWVVSSPGYRPGYRPF